MRVMIKSIKNGWRLKYNVDGWAIDGQVVDTSKIITHEEERAFTYDFDDEEEAAWNALIEFMQKQFGMEVHDEKKYRKYECKERETYENQGFAVHRLESRYDGWRKFYWVPAEAHFCPFCGKGVKEC